MLARSSTSAVRAAAAPVQGARSFFAAKASSQSYQYALDEEFPGVPKAAAAAKAAKPTVATSTTAAGLKLASDDGAPLVASLGVEIKAGSRTETDETAGLSQLFAKMAFRATDARSDLRLFRDVEALGGVVHKRAGRDFVRYSISVLPHQLERAAAILAETTLAPRFAQWDIETIKKQVAIDAHASAACSERTVFENVHGAAFYDDVSLGRPQFSLDNLAAFSTDDLAAFYEQYVNTAGLALVGSGVDHATLTAVANDFFAGVPAAAAPLAKAPATYVGGESRVKKNGVKNTYVALGFPTAGAKDAGAARVLEALLTQRLRSKKAAGFQATYADAGLVGLRGFAAPADAGALVDTFAAEIKKAAAAAPSNEELAAAKTAAAIAVADEVYSREGKLAFLGAAAHAQAVATPFADVQAVSAKAVQELAQKAVASRPALASVGKLSAVPRLDALLNKLK